MFKLMKYELRKQLFSKFFILIVMALLEVMFIYGLFGEDRDKLGASIGLFIFAATAALTFVSFESIITYSNDLKTKQSYMIFLTPNSMYKVVGAKILTTVVSILLTTLAFGLLISLNIGLVFVKFKDAKELLDILIKNINSNMNASIDVQTVVLYVANLVIETIRIVIIGMAAITLSATFLSNSKLKGFVSLIIFFFFSWGVGKLAAVLYPTTTLTFSTTDFLFLLLYESAVVVVFYFATVFMLDKKVSV